MKKFDKKIQIKIFNLILIVVWMIIVFIFSAQRDTESDNTSRSFTVAIIEVITNKKMQPEDPFIVEIQHVIRKLAHFTLYTIGGFLIMNYAHTTRHKCNKQVLYSIAFGGGYACTDELHQAFVPGRGPSAVDVGIDTLGIICGILIFLSIKKILSIIKNKR